MRSARSWFNPTLYKKNLTRFWPVWTLYLVIWLFLFPVALILDNYSSPERFARRAVLDAIPEAGLIIALCFGLLTAAAVWSYLCNNRASCLIHTLPIRREGLFLTNYLSGMTFFVGPNLIVLVLTLLAEAAAGCVDVGVLLLWFFSVTMLEWFFFSFASFCAVFTGHVLGLPAFYAVANGLASGLVALIDMTLSRFVFGYAGIEKLYRIAEWLTPVWKLSDGMEVRRLTEHGVSPEIYQFVGLGYVLIYAVAGVVLSAIVLAVYRRRDIERTGDVVSVPRMRPVFQYGVAFCCALTFGSLLFEMFRNAVDDSVWLLLFFMLVCGAVGYFAARMILEKSFRVFGCWKGCVPFLVLLVLLTCAMEYDLAGYERYVPEEDEVVSVSVSDMSTRPYDEADYTVVDSRETRVIRAVLDAHRAIVDNQQELERGIRYGSEEAYQNGVWMERDYEYSGFNVAYTLANGKTVYREYNRAIPVYAEDLDDPGTVTYKLNTLFNLPEVVAAGYRIDGERVENIYGVWLDGFYWEEPDGAYYTKQTDIPKEVWAELLRAVQEDLRAGDLGRRYLMDTDERMENCFANDLTFSFYRESNPYPEIAVAQPYPTALTAPDVHTERITVTLQVSAKRTMEVLERYGLQENLITQTSLEEANLWWEKNGSWAEFNPAAFIWEGD